MRRALRSIGIVVALVGGGLGMSASEGSQLPDISAAHLAMAREWSVFESSEWDVVGPLQRSQDEQNAVLGLWTDDRLLTTVFGYDVGSKDELLNDLDFVGAFLDETDPLFLLPVYLRLGRDSFQDLGMKIVDGEYFKPARFRQGKGERLLRDFKILISRFDTIAGKYGELR